MIDSLLVVCTGNICRSPMGEALCKQYFDSAGKRLRISSAGVGALVGFPPPDEAIELMKATHGIDISGHRARQITQEMARDYDLILVMEKEQQRAIENWWPMLRGRVKLLGEWQDEEIIDPYRQSIEVFRQSLGQIESGIRDWTEKLFK